MNEYTKKQIKVMDKVEKFEERKIEKLKKQGYSVMECMVKMLKYYNKLTKMLHKVGLTHKDVRLYIEKKKGVKVEDEQVGGDA